MVALNSRVILLPRGHLAILGDILGSHNWEGSATGLWQIEAMDATQHPT